ncbi:MAG: hypothetical protein GWP18_00630 [Proteobacteria bacterium]|nr:hypothetical protein [Pseudomonadota bacterium]
METGLDRGERMTGYLTSGVKHSCGTHRSNDLRIPDLMESPDPLRNSDLIAAA